MDVKNLEKMFEVIVSLEPRNPRPVKIDESKEISTKKLINTSIEDIKFEHKPRKPSLPLSIPMAYVRRGSVDPRKSLFQNEKSQSSNNLNRLTLFHSNSKSLSKVPQEMDFTDIIDEDLSQIDNRTKNEDDSDIYEMVSPLSNDEEKNLRATYMEMKSDSGIEIITTSKNPKKMIHRNSLEILKNKNLRHSDLSENDSNQRSVEENTSLYAVMQSAPQSARHSALTPFSCSKDNQSSIDSGVDQIISINIHSCSESFSDLSESNVNNFMDKELNESPIISNWMNTSVIPAIPSDTQIKCEESSHMRIIPIIKSEEEQKKFYRMISNELSLNSFTTKEIIKFYMRDGTFSSQIIDKFQTASSVCNTFKMKFSKPDEVNGQIVEVLSKESIERPVEDHENILNIFYTWEKENCTNRFIFQENLNMYKIFTQPNAFVNEMKYDFEITDIMWVKGIGSKWTRALCSIQDGCVYYTNKHRSKDHKDLNQLVNLKKADFYICLDTKKIKKEYKSPTAELIVFKENKRHHRTHDNAYLAALNYQQKEKWLEALKVAKYSFIQLRDNYLESQMCFPTGFRSQANSEVTTIGD